VHSIDELDTEQGEERGRYNQEPVIWNRKNNARTNSITLLYLSKMAMFAAQLQPWEEVSLVPFLLEYSWLCCLVSTPYPVRPYPRMGMVSPVHHLTSTLNLHPDTSSTSTTNILLFTNHLPSIVLLTALSRLYPTSCSLLLHPPFSSKPNLATLFTP
jgi:hypothetical protein